MKRKLNVLNHQLNSENKKIKLSNPIEETDIYKLSLKLLEELKILKQLKKKMSVDYSTKYDLEIETLSSAFKAASSKEITELDFNCSKITFPEISNTIYRLKNKKIPNNLKKVCQPIIDYSTSVFKEKLPKCNNTMDSGTVEMLHLDSITMGDVIITVLSLMMAKNNNLEILKINGNNISDVGISVLSEILKGNKVLKTLEINNNNFGDEGMFFLSEMLKKSPLIKLGLNHNYVTNTGALQLSDVLIKENKNLTEISLNNNEIDNTEITAFSNAIKCNPFITKFSVNDLLGNNDQTSINNLIFRNKKAQKIILNALVNNCFSKHKFKSFESDKEKFSEINDNYKNYNMFIYLRLLAKMSDLWLYNQITEVYSDKNYSSEKFNSMISDAKYVLHSLYFSKLSETFEENDIIKKVQKLPEEIQTLVAGYITPWDIDELEINVLGNTSSVKENNDTDWQIS